MTVRQGRRHDPVEPPRSRPVGMETDPAGRLAPSQPARRSVLKTCKTGIRALAFALAPGPALALFSMYDRRQIEAQAAAHGLVDLARRIAARTGSTVQRGPFAGMRLDIDAFPVHIAPKLAGTYEAELHEMIEEALQRSPRTIVNIGCAEGYYAVGIARRLPHVIVHAHDADRKAIKATRHHAALNRVERRVQTGGALTPARLQKLASQSPALLIMDIEGGEGGLLDPVHVPALRAADILVELHPDRVPDIESRISGRFADSHRLRLIRERPTETKLDHAPAGLSAADRWNAVDERRPSSQSWLWLTAQERAQLPA